MTPPPPPSSPDAVDAAGTDPRRRALVLALASDVVYGIRGRRRAAAIEAISCAEAVGPSAAAALHRALVNLFMAKVFAAEGLDAELLDRAAAPRGEPADRRGCTTAPICIAGCGPAIPRTWTPRGPRCGGP